MGEMQCQALVGRESELAALTDGLDRLSDETGGVIFLVGEPGVGKSRLAREAASIAAARDVLILTGRAVQAATPVPLRPVVEALMGATRTTEVPDAAEIAEFRPALGSLVPAWDTGGERDAEISPLILGEALVRLLTLLSKAGTLLVLEELEWADPETLAIVEYLADNLADRSVLCVATLRNSEPSAALDVVRTIHARRAGAVVQVPRLTGQQVEQMAAACLDQQTVPPAMGQRLLRDCDGLPFAVEELLAAAASSGELMHCEAGWAVNEDITTGVPTSIAGSVRNRLAGLGPEVTDVIVSAAVLGRQFDWTLLPAVAEVTEPEVLAALRRAREVQLIEPDSSSQVVLRFRHSLTRDAILSDLLPPEAAGRSARAAAAIEDAHPGLPGAWCELAADLHEAAGQPVRAAALLFEAGRRAFRHGALTSARASLGKARAVLAKTASAEPELLIDIDDTLTNVLMFAGDCDQLVPAAERLLAELDATGAPLARKACIRLRVARSLSESDRVVAAEQQAAAARSLAAASADPALAGWTDAVAARCAIDGGDPDRALDLAHRSLAAAESAGLTGSAAEAACEALEVVGRRERVRDIEAAQAAFERAYQIASGHELPLRQIRALHELGTIEMLANGGSERLAEAKRLALESGAISTTTVLDLQLANAWSMGTDLERSLAAASQCQQAAGRLNMRRVEAMALSVQACLFGIRTEREHAELVAEQAEATAPGDPEILTTAWGEARVTAAIFVNDLASAADASSNAISYARKEPLSAPSLAWGYWPLLQTICGTEGRQAIDEARATGAEVAYWNRGCLAYAEAVLQGRDGQRDLAGELAAEGGRLFQHCAPWWNHALHRLVAPAALEDGWGEPAAWLRDAIGDLEASGHDRLATACRGILRRAGERVPRSGRGNTSVPSQLRRLGVTSREMDVFVLVGRGCSTTEIASRLFISPKTVETHIASLVAKTGRQGRRELVALAARHAS
ncbi:MAG TPA: AAA family ATPase [Streptosporangiaceae bacterium]|nr:AAA family ATPase [Streptosporangiaceae bacterium]